MTRRRALQVGGGALGAGALAAYGLGGRAASAATTGVRAAEASAAATTPYEDPWHAKVVAAGYRRRTARIGDVTFSYREGPKHGPPLVLLHAQQMDWFSYSRVMPALAESFHVFDVDYQGHGETRTTAHYPMNANRIGTDLARLLERVVGRPAYVTGNSSGGLLTVWLAANRPQLVQAALLEDPPLFAAEYPRIKKTIAYRDFRTSAKGVAQHVEDFLVFWVKDSQEFFDTYVGPGVVPVLVQAIEAQRKARPGVPVELGVIPDDTVRLFLRGMDHQYDPRFGAAFFHGTWNRGFDHARALRQVRRPTMLLKANSTWVDHDILNGAMTSRDASKAMSLLRDGTYRKIDATHVTHLAKPDEFTAILTAFFRRHP